MKRQLYSAVTAGGQVLLLYLTPKTARAVSRECALNLKVLS